VAFYALGTSFLLGGALGGLVSAVLILMIARRRSIGADAAIGVITSAAFAVGIVIISVIGSFTRNFEAALFGNVLGVSSSDVLVVAIVAVGIAATVFFRYRQLLFTTFDPEVADVSGVSTATADLVLALLLTALITVCMSVLGVTLIAAMLVMPPVIGRLLTDSFHKMLWISVVVGTFCGFVGVYLSYYLNWASGPAVVLTAAGLFAVAYAVSSVRRRRIPEAALDAHVG
jgi:manganese/iron transport system permease protein/iron/zinc/copper transport system permease protein